MKREPIKTDVLIVGAGVAGLVAGIVLARQRLGVILVDQSQKVGGRLATQRIGPGRADHGAQFFTVRSPEFQIWVEAWQSQGLVYRWSRGWSDGSLGPAALASYPRYAVRGGMNALARHLARGLDTRVKVRLETITLAEQGWQAQTESGQLYSSRALLLTPPVPQSLALLAAGQVKLVPHEQTALARIEYAPCLCGLFWVDGSVSLPEPGALQQPEAPISWIADNQRKGISPEATIITVHARPETSYQFWEAPEAEALEMLRAGLQPFLAADAKILEAQLKRWRYALPTTLHPQRYLLAADTPPLAFAGDAFAGPRVEGAALSGLTASRALITKITSLKFAGG